MSAAGGGFADDAKVGAKVEKFLGIGQAGLQTSAVVGVQKEGWLMKKPFTGSEKGAWQRRYFMLKDSFLFWYDKKGDGGGFRSFRATQRHPTTTRN